MTQLDPDHLYRSPYGKLQSSLDRHALRTQTMLVAAMIASLTLVAAAAAMVMMLF